MTEAESAVRARASALRLLTRREHSRHELRRKLEQRRFDTQLVEALLDELESERLLSDTRYAELLVSNRAERGYGPLRIRMELGERGVAREIVEQTLADAEVDWDACLRDIYVRKYGESQAHSFELWASRAQFLRGRGFSADRIRRVIGDFEQ